MTAFLKEILFDLLFERDLKTISISKRGGGVIRKCRADDAILKTHGDDVV